MHLASSACLTTLSHGTEWLWTSIRCIEGPTSTWENSCLKTGDVAKAKERLAVLDIACPDGCEERDELADAIAIATQ